MKSQIDQGLLEILPDIFNKSFNAIIVLQPLRTPQGEIIDFIYKYMNDTCFKFLEGNRTNYIGKRLLNVFPKTFNAGIFDLYKSVAETGSPTEKEFYYEDEQIKGWFKNAVFKQQDDIVVYFRDISKNKQLELMLMKSLQEKEILLKEIHHRVKNSLQIIASILNIQSAYTEDPQVNKLFIDSQTRIKAVALIHQKLYETSHSLLSIDLKGYVQDLVNAIHETLHNNKEEIKIQCHIKNIEVPANAAINLGLILNELITNAIKYAFPVQKRGEIKIAVLNNDHHVITVVEDNGIGFPEYIDLKNSETLGLKLIDSLVQQLDGNIDLDRSEGSKFTITFSTPLLH